MGPASDEGHDECAAEDTVQAFVDGSLGDDARRSFERHVDACGGCRMLLAEVGRALSRSNVPQCAPRETRQR
jgi:hypothetical protein